MVWPVSSSSFKFLVQIAIGGNSEEVCIPFMVFRII